MIKGLSKLAALAMFVVLAALALCVTSASARPYGITGGNKQCVRGIHHKHHRHHQCKKHHPKRHNGHKHVVKTEKTVTENVENGEVNTSPEVKPMPKQPACIIETVEPGYRPVTVGGDCEGFEGRESCSSMPQGCVELPILIWECRVVPGGCEPSASPCSEKICVLPEPPCPEEKQEEVPGPKG